MSDVTIPQFSMPFRLDGGTTPAVTEQDTTAEITDAITNVMRFTVGSRVELQNFGVPDGTFTQGGADPAEIEAAILEWEPRADTVATADNTSLSDLITTILVEVTGGTT